MRVEGLKPCEFYFTCCRLTTFKNNFSINGKRDEILYISRKLNSKLDLQREFKLTVISMLDEIYIYFSAIFSS